MLVTEVILVDVVCYGFLGVRTGAWYQVGVCRVFARVCKHEGGFCRHEFVRLGLWGLNFEIFGGAGGLI